MRPQMFHSQYGFPAHRNSDQQIITNQLQQSRAHVPNQQSLNYQTQMSDQQEYLFQNSFQPKVELKKLSVYQLQNAQQEQISKVIHLKQVKSLSQDPSAGTLRGRGLHREDNLTKINKNPFNQKIALVNSSSQFVPQVPNQTNQRFVVPIQYNVNIDQGFQIDSNKENLQTKNHIEEILYTVATGVPTSLNLNLASSQEQENKQINLTRVSVSSSSCLTEQSKLLQESFHPQNYERSDSKVNEIMSLLNNQLGKNNNKIITSAEFGTQQKSETPYLADNNTPKSTIQKYKFSFSGLNGDIESDSEGDKKDSSLQQLSSNINNFLKHITQKEDLRNIVQNLNLCSLPQLKDVSMIQNLQTQSPSHSEDNSFNIELVSCEPRNGRFFQNCKVTNTGNLLNNSEDQFSSSHRAKPPLQQRQTKYVQCTSADNKKPSTQNELIPVVKVLGKNQQKSQTVISQKKYVTHPVIQEESIKQVLFKHSQNDQIEKKRQAETILEKERVENRQLQLKLIDLQKNKDQIHQQKQDDLFNFQLIEERNKLRKQHLQNIDTPKEQKKDVQDRQLIVNQLLKKETVVVKDSYQDHGIKKEENTNKEQIIINPNDLKKNQEQQKEELMRKFMAISTNTYNLLPQIIVEKDNIIIRTDLDSQLTQKPSKQEILLQSETKTSPTREPQTNRLSSITTGQSDNKLRCEEVKEKNLGYFQYQLSCYYPKLSSQCLEFNKCITQHSDVYTQFGILLQASKAQSSNQSKSKNIKSGQRSRSSVQKNRKGHHQNHFRSLERLTKLEMQFQQQFQSNLSSTQQLSSVERLNKDHAALLGSQTKSEGDTFKLRCKEYFSMVEKVETPNQDKQISIKKYEGASDEWNLKIKQGSLKSTQQQLQTQIQLLAPPQEEEICYLQYDEKGGQIQGGFDLIVKQDALMTDLSQKQFGLDRQMQNVSDDEQSVKGQKKFFIEESFQENETIRSHRTKKSSSKNYSNVQKAYKQVFTKPQRKPSRDIHYQTGSSVVQDGSSQNSFQTSPRKTPKIKQNISSNSSYNSNFTAKHSSQKNFVTKNKTQRQPKNIDVYAEFKRALNKNLDQFTVSTQSDANQQMGPPSTKRQGIDEKSEEQLQLYQKTLEQVQVKLLDMQKCFIKKK